MGNERRWRFVRAGGFDQVRLDRADEIANLDQLDQKLWVALACPATNLEFDKRTLALVDSDSDGRIRAPEIIAASKWTCAMLKDANNLASSSPSVPLSNINDSTDEGKLILASAKQILKDLGKGDATAIALDEVADTQKIFATTAFNGDGIIPADSAEDDATKALITDIIKTHGAETDRSTKPGVNVAKVEQFFKDCEAFSAWHQQAADDPNILPTGEATLAAVAAVTAVKAKIDDFFSRTRLAAFDARSLGAMNRGEGEFAAIGGQTLSANAAELVNFPLAAVEADAALPLESGLNPAWSAQMATFVKAAVVPLLGARSNLTSADWATLNGRLAPCLAWQAAKAGAIVEPLTLPRVREILAGNGKATVLALIAKDQALEPEAAAIAQVEKLVRFNRDLYQLLNNFVAFHDFYNRKKMAIFQAGTLYLDQRACNLCIRVDNVAKHSALAGLSCAYVAYLDCTRPSGAKMSIAAAFTGGDSDFLAIGRNGVFYDRDGKDWDAVITKVVASPISVREAIWSPYKKFAKLIEDQIAKFANAREKSVETSATAKVGDAGKAVESAAAKTPEKKDAFDVARFAGIFAAIGLAIGAIGGAIGAMLGAFSRLAWWQMPLAVLGIFILISGPSVLIAWLKLRRRNIGPLLDANGWAINARAKINIPFGGSLTSVAALPLNAERDLVDPYVERHTVRNVIIALIVVGLVGFITWRTGLFERVLPDTLPKPAWLIDKEYQEAMREMELKKQALELKAAAEAAVVPAPATPVADAVLSAPVAPAPAAPAAPAPTQAEPAPAAAP